MFSKKDLQRLIVPLIIEQFLSITIGMADTVMVSVCGEATVSGVSLVDAINILLINIFSALATGGAIVSSQYIGREEPHQACEAAKQLILSVFVLSTAIGALFVFGGPQILGFIYHDVESAVMQNAEIYFFLTALSYPFIALYNAGAALFRAMGNSRISMVISIVMNCINVGGNALFIFGFDMGAAGAALATLISRIVGAIFILILQEYYFSRKLKEVAEMNAAGKNVINLGIGSPDLPPSEQTIETLCEHARKPNEHGYQPYVGIPELRKGFADWYKKWYDVDLDPKTEIQPLIGSKEGILHISLAFLNPGDGVLVPNPGYPTYSSVSKLVEANLIPYKLKEELGWQPDFEELEKMDLSNVMRL